MKRDKPYILIIYTGGTIGMIKDPKTGILKVFDFEHLTSNIPELSRLNVELKSISFENPLDSSEMNPARWIEIAQIIFDNYAVYDGFVVLHGSDTMAFTASALSFMFQNLSKPIIFTGSQLPIGTIRTDGKENLITAIEIAASSDENGIPLVQEVAIYFEYSLYRGNRTTKISATQFEAFSSPNFPELAVAGVDIAYRLPDYENQKPPLELFTAFDNRVALLKIFPGFSPMVYQSIFDFTKVKGIIIESYGSGNVPSDSSFNGLIKKYLDEGGIVLNITQCSTGAVHQGKYETSSFFSQVGVVGGSDLTTEAAVTKMMYLLGKYKTKEEIVEKLAQNLAGEMTGN